MGWLLEERLMSMVEPVADMEEPAAALLALALGVRDMLEALRARSPSAGVIPETWEGPGLVIGVEVLVDK